MILLTLKILFLATLIILWASFMFIWIYGAFRKVWPKTRIVYRQGPPGPQGAPGLSRKDIQALIKAELKAQEEK